MKKITLLIITFLLTGCDVPTKMEENWREAFFLNIPSEKIELLLGPLILFLALLSFLAALFSILSFFKSGRISSKFWRSVLLMVCVPVVVLLFFDFVNKIEEMIFPSDLTLESVLTLMRWELSSNLGDMITSGWGIVVTFLLPILVSRWQIVMYFLSIIGIAISIINASWRGIIFIVAQIVGWAIFLPIYNAIVHFLGENYPDGWSFSGVAVAFNVFYIAAVLLALLFCYIVMPLSVLIFPFDEGEPKDSRPPRDWERILAPILVGGKEEKPVSRQELPLLTSGSGDSEEGGSSPQTPRPAEDRRKKTARKLATVANVTSAVLAPNSLPVVTALTEGAVAAVDRMDEGQSPLPEILDTAAELAGDPTKKKELESLAGVVRNLSGKGPRVP